jgi:transposase
MFFYRKMTAQRDKRVEVSGFLRAGFKVNEVANLVRVSPTTVYAIKKRMDDAGSDRKSVVDQDILRDAIQSSPLTSMRQHARRLGVGTATVRRAVAKLGGKSLVMVERPLLTPTIRAKCLERCQRLMPDLKSAPTGRVIIFSDEKTCWTVDPVRNRRNDLLAERYVAAIHENICIFRSPIKKCLRASGTLSQHSPS